MAIEKDAPLPCEGALVTWEGAPTDDPVWTVVKITTGGRQPNATLRSLSKPSLPEMHRVRDLSSGAREGIWVEHQPSPGRGQGFGVGRILRKRHEGVWQQLLVEFPERGERRWIPWQRLSFAMAPEFLYRHGILGDDTSAERFRLRCLALGLQYWNENTGSLSRFDIDPLPHQIHLVHHILSSGNYNWLIADDVGLGKTIEAGLLIAALKQREIAKRVMIIVPAGLVRQWQEDLRLKFGLDDFLVFGADFEIKDPAHWRLFPRVIASMDRIKDDSHIEMLLEAEPWDLVVFDEAHRLTRKEFGQKFTKSQRYRLAERLRPHVRSMLMLSATPHQGRHDQFSALLQLLRPELTKQLQQPEIPPGLLRQMVFRNRKAEVTDSEGQLLFRGQTSRMVEVPSTPELKELETQLESYLRRGALAGDGGNQQARAIGFVMIVYRKLAASSLFALREALARRLARLEHKAVSEVFAQANIEDERYEGEAEERMVAESPTTEFFAGEIEQLRTLLDLATEAIEHDTKLQSFLDKVVDAVLRTNPDEKLLIFSEYRGTQEYLRRALARRYGEDKVDLINGSMSVEERIQSIQRFEQDGQFLLSTEAGGEGLNLQRRCHVMVNYDLPWNPMRLAQRIGRLYRYGQTKDVVTFNLQASNSADELVVSKMYQRLETVARDMAEVEAKTTDVLVADIVGELASLLDIEAILENARTISIRQTQEKIDEAIEKARDAAAIEREMFRHASAFDARSMSQLLRMELDHFQAFVIGMVKLIGGKVMLAPRKGKGVFHAELPRGWGRNGHKGPQQFYLTFDRSHAPQDDGVELLHMDHPLAKRLCDHATTPAFRGQAACVSWSKGPEHVGVALLRWQDETGTRIRSELTVVEARDEAIAIDPAPFADWLKRPQASAPMPVQAPSPSASRFTQTADIQLGAVLQARATADSLPEMTQWIGFAGSRPSIWKSDLADPGE